MEATRGLKVHVINVGPAFTEMLQQKAPYLDIIRIPLRDFYGCPDATELGDPEDIEVLICLSWNLSKLLTAGVQFPNLKWVHSISAGVGEIADYFTQSQTRPHYVITRALVSADCVSEYVIGQILASRRKLYDYHDQQKLEPPVWARHFTEASRTLRDLSVVLLGVGAIGKRMAELCNAFGMTVHGVTRSPVKKEKGLHMFTITEDLLDALSEGDYIVNTLPATPLTRGLLDNDVLQACRKKKPVFVNVGRGDVISEESILKALRCGWISGAILDVFPVEPLPADSLLWKEPGVVVTPHIAMDMFGLDTRVKAVDTFLDNYHRFIKQQPLMDVVDVERGY